jgi:hypothetical protein
MSEIVVPMTRKNVRMCESGRKIATTRGKPFGGVGDKFTMKGSEYEYTVMAVMCMPLEVIQELFYYAEGADSPEEFEKIYRGIYYGRFPAKSMKYLHFFSKIVECELT